MASFLVFQYACLLFLKLALLALLVCAVGLCDRVFNHLCLSGVPSQFSMTGVVFKDSKQKVE